MTEPHAHTAPLFLERGASWYWVLFGPISAGLLLVIQNSSGFGFQPLVPMVLLVLVSLMLAIQVKAARIHTSVELSQETLRQGTETIRVADILAIYPEAERPTGWGKSQLQKWQESRALGELSGVPRRRMGIGLRLTGRRTVQAWARDHRRLRAALSELIPETVSPGGPAETDIDDGSPW
ncbi:hypothetical protein BST33_02820 [Mycolicibacter minnesotensis]|uniref:Uncharacterized protein n=1 Tax=Mycolicibacter minnesotensis TaxID=1118379 RepID=A0A7I7R670_9MYCO|nr:hypothetical protein [Mycolicibacter minnesotensis]ORB03879.1 hypothetical protein BST33_02820 [Mycolicibacter minnesotensis]BBY34163.1 hypothetical protein MMIN_22240 [Mycolicibacter minnesotensis]